MSGDLAILLKKMWKQMEKQNIYSYLKISLPSSTTSINTCDTCEIYNLIRSINYFTFCRPHTIFSPPPFFYRNLLWKITKESSLQNRHLYYLGHHKYLMQWTWSWSHNFGQYIFLLRYIYNICKHRGLRKNSSKIYAYDFYVHKLNILKALTIKVSGARSDLGKKC